MPKKAQLSIPKPGNVFGNVSGSDEEDGSDWVKKALRAEGQKNLMKKQTRLTMAKALTQDPTVYQYDEVYDEMERTKMEVKAVKKEEKKPKYINNLLKAAERRKREQEHRIERMVQKEREAEGAMYADKESFVTSAYRAKLEEFKKMEEEEKNADRLEAIGDVTKQQDMSGFYRHLYQQTTEGEKADKNVETEVQGKEVEQQKEIEEKIDSNIDQDDPLSSNSDSEDQKTDEANFSKKAKENNNTLSKKTRKRQYRKRTAEASDSKSESESDVEKKGKNSHESTEEQASLKKTDSPQEEPESKKQKLTTEQPQIPATENKNTQDIEAVVSQNGESTSKAIESNDHSPEKNLCKVEDERKEKVSIWVKRTVGPVFEAALQRYYTRKAARSTGGA